MKQDIILSGVGGQGILSIAFVLVNSANIKGLNSKQAEVHGMSQRGGPVFAFVRISDEPIYSDLIPAGEADMIISLESMEALRYSEYLKPDGHLIVDRTQIEIDSYDKESIDNTISSFPRHLYVNARQAAKEAGNALSANMVMVGAASPFLSIEESHLKESIKTLFSRKSVEVIETNLIAFDKGVELSKKLVADL
jgi:indolepyruvate ferredoxin oxidoreductase beta subunit